MKRSRTTLARRRARYTRRLVIFEDPEVAKKLEQLATDAGHSVAAEVRAATRYWIDAHEPEGR